MIDQPLAVAPGGMKRRPRKVPAGRSGGPVPIFRHYAEAPIDVYLSFQLLSTYSQ
jgi:hypothetical protein